MYFTTASTGKPRLPYYITILCLACVLILVGNGASLIGNLSSLRGANTLQSQTSRVGDRLQYLNVLVMDAESSLRGYFLSGSDAYLGPWRTASAEIDPALAELDTLLADNPSQRRNLGQLRALIHRRMSLMNQSVEVYRQGGLHDIVKIAETGDTKSVMDEIRLLVVIMAQEQNELLAARAAAFYRDYQNAVLIGVGINVVAILVLGLFYRLVRRSYFTRVATEQALQAANDNLESMVAQRTEQLSVLSRHLISVAEVEKAKLARELHDEMGANLTAISMDINTVSARLAASDPQCGAMLERARAALVDTVELKRRIIEDLRPSMLDHLGLSAALHSYCAQFKAVSGVHCEALVDGEVDVADPMQSIAVFRIVQESLNNIGKYAQARNVVVHLAREDDALFLEVSDDGIGIPVDAASKARSHGLLGMRERALLLGGSLKVQRGPGQVGTCVSATIPLTQLAGGVAGAPSVPHPAAGGHIPSSPPCSTHPHTLPDLDGQLP
ncbi:MAG: CHASE3 domain-containing protein [Pseudomonadota bacterium]